jgi:hypothetical protein
MMKEILSMVDMEHERLARLKKQLRNAADHESALLLVKQIEQTKLRIERNTMQVQLDYAKREGRMAAAAKLVESIKALDRMIVASPATDEAGMRNTESR